MGAGSSSLSDLPNNVYLRRLVSTEIITANDPYWNQLLSFSLKLPNTIADHRLLEESIAPLFASLLQNNKLTGNLCSLIQVFLSRATELKASAQLENSVFTWQTFNALFVLQHIIKLLLENISEEETISTLQAIPSNSPKSNKAKDDISNLVELFTTSLVEVIVDVPLSHITYDLHLEATSTLIVLISSHIFAGTTTAPRFIILRSLLVGRPAIHTYLLAKTLLKRFTAQNKPPPSQEQGSIILGLASGLWNVLTLGASGSEDEPSDATSPKLPPLARQSLLLTLVLSNHFTADRNTPNPFRTAILNAQNFQDPAETTPSQAVTTFKVEYSTLLNTLTSQLHSEAAALLLYTLLHRNESFRTFVLSRTDVDTLILPLLRTLYCAAEAPSDSAAAHHVYMALIILLILSEDESFNKTIHDIHLKEVPWYTERPINQISLGGLLILVVIRTIAFNMTKMRDKYLHTNCLAALANMSGQFRQLHPYVCQRIVNLFETLARRHAKLLHTLKQPPGAADDNADSDISDVMSDISVVEEVLRMVLEIVNSAVTRQLAHNHDLLYALLYKRHLIDTLAKHSTFSDVAANIATVLEFLMKRLEAATAHPSVADVQAAIAEGVMTVPRARLRQASDLRFKYVEESDPDEFFVPYVWTLVFRSAGIYWQPSKVTLFDTSHR